eukprot:10150271-Heterocapsa_arctica.AAC.1
MARHLQQARLKKTKWVVEFGFIEEGNDDDADHDDEVTVDESQVNPADVPGEKDGTKPGVPANPEAIRW